MIGTVIGGRYTIRAPVGEGGMATIYRAHDSQLDRDVAVKILRPQYGRDPGFAARFRQEARSAGSLNHPNIVSVYDYGTDGDAHYIVMQLVEGRDLASVLREDGRLSPNEAARIAAETASALETAHRRGIVHRDIKPGNILLTDDGDVRVTDFGIARAVSEASMTITGTTLGSVHYFSPEQARGDEVTGASDVYALGIVLYEMLTLRRPFEGDSAAGVALKRLSEDPQPPSVYDRSLPPGLVAIVMRALERDPAARFASAGELAQALQAWQRDPGGMPVAFPPPRPPAGEPTIYMPPPASRVQQVNVAPPRPRYEEEESRGQPWWIWLLVLLALAMLGIIGFIGAQIFTGFGPADSSTPPAVAQVEIPNWEGDPISAVRLEAAELGIELEEDRETSDEIAEDAVIRTEPEAGAMVDRGSTVLAIVSSGADTVAVPELTGQTRDEATRRLESVGLALGAVSFEEHPTQPRDTVIRTIPTVGTEVAAGSDVDIVLSSGPAPTPEPTPTPVPTPTPTPVPTPTPEPTTLLP